LITIRSLRLQDAADSILRAARFREPQRKSFDRVVQIVDALYDDLPELSDSELRDQLAEMGYPAADGYPDFQFALATGVGKRRLMGAIATYLIAGRQTNNVLILASRAAILDKLEREIYPESEDYLFLDPHLVPSPNVCLRANLESFRPSADDPNIFVLSPQSITGSGRRAAKRGDFKEESLLDYLRRVEDLVVLTDEAHHIGDVDTAWRGALTNLDPRLHFGFTATPRDIPGRHAYVLYRYDLADCLRDGLYTKQVRLLVNEHEEGVDDDDWDRSAIDYSLARLRSKAAALDDYRLSENDFPAIRPVLLLATRDIEQATRVGRWLREARGFSESEVLVTHSKKAETEDDIRALVSIDAPGSPVQVVVHVNRLSEGWDVTNVYVVTPLRSLATYQLAIQTLGRGLRLPAGRRVGDEELDTLDVVLFGRESATEIYEDARRDFRDPELDTPVIGVKRADDVPEHDSRPKRIADVPIVGDVSFTVPAIRRLPPRYDLDFEIEVPNRLMKDLVTQIGLDRKVTIDTAQDSGASYPYQYLIDATRGRVCAQLSFLNERDDGAAVDRLTKGVLQKLGGNDGGRLFVDPLRLAVLIAREIIKRRGQVQPTYAAAVGAAGRLVHFKPVRIHVLAEFDGYLPPDEVEEP
jgi:superfamily II DNA or RNA helicase